MSAPLLLYDLTELGRGYGRNDHLSGIPRVVQSLIDPIRKTWPHEMAFTGVGDRPGTHGWVKQSRPDLLAQLACHPTWRERGHRHIKQWHVNSWGNSLFKRRTFQRIFSRLFQCLSVPEEAVPVDLAQRAALFHSFVGPIPPEVRQNPRMGAFLTVHDLIPILQPQYSWPPWNAYIERAFASIHARNPGDHVFAVSQTVKEEFCAHSRFPENRVTVTPHAADPTLFYPCHGKEMEQGLRQQLGLGEEPYFLTLCQIAPRKNLPGLIEAFSLAIRDPSLRDHRLVLAGRCVPEEQGRLLALARSHGVESRLIITGFVPDESLAPLYSHASAFVFPTFAEGFGLPAVEAMQCGCPLVCSDLRVLREVAGDAAIYADPHRPEDIARALVDVIDPATHDHLQIKGQTRSSCFSWKKTADQIVQTYFQILKTVGVP